ncbi:MAG: hypothetical protein ACJ76X_10520 [Solirubrobacteraceae bacterium]|jgi:hypothetical protein
MGYKVLGFVVWQGARLYFRRRVNGTKRKIVLAGLAAAVVGGVVAASQREPNSS